MQTIVNTPTIDELLMRLRANKHYSEYKMTTQGFTAGKEHCYEPSELVIVNIYTFRDTLYPEAKSFIYILRDQNYTIGFSVDDYREFENNEANFYHWFLAKVQRNLSFKE